MKKFFVVVLAVIAVLLASCASASIDAVEEKWVFEPYDADHPQDDYLMAVGSGTGRNPAIDSAMQSLAQSFSVDVMSTTSTDSAGGMTVRDGSRSSYSDVFSGSSVHTLSNVRDIVAVEVFEVVEHDGMFHARVGVDRKKAIDILSGRIDGRYAAIEAELAKAATATPIKALSICSAVYEDALGIDGYILQLEVLSGKGKRRLADRIAEIRNSVLSGRSVSVKLNVPRDYDDDAVRGMIESALTGVGLEVVRSKGDFSLSCDVGTSSDRTKYVVDTVVVTLTISDSYGSNSVSSMEKVTSLNESMGVQNVMKHLDTEIDELVGTLLAF